MLMVWDMWIEWNKEHVLFGIDSNDKIKRNRIQNLVKRTYRESERHSCGILFTFAHASKGTHWIINISLWILFQLIGHKRRHKCDDTNTDGNWDAINWKFNLIYLFS